MILKDYHIHTNFCDGKNTPEEVVLSAIKMGLTEIGFSGHSYVEFDTDFCISKEKIPEYIAEIERLKVKYSGKISILCGIEQDYYSDEPTDCFDFVIGSVHYIKSDDTYIPVDLSPEILKEAIKIHFNNNNLLFVKAYFDMVSDVVNKTNADVIGHFDLLTKFNEIEPIFDTSDERYVNLWKNAVDKLLAYNKPFEINTGAISRGYKTFPYPSDDIIAYIKQKGGKFILTSDSHSADTLCYKFEEFEYLL